MLSTRLLLIWHLLDLFLLLLLLLLEVDVLQRLVDVSDLRIETLLGFLLWNDGAVKPGEDELGHELLDGCLVWDLVQESNLVWLES